MTLEHVTFKWKHLSVHVTCVFMCVCERAQHFFTFSIITKKNFKLICNFDLMFYINWIV